MRLAAALQEISLPIVLAGVTLVVAWLLPGHYLPWTMFQQETAAALAGLLLCAGLAQDRTRMYWPALAVVLAALAAVPWLQFALGQIRFVDDAVLASTYLVAASLAVSIGVSAARGRLGGQLTEALTASFFAAALLSVAIAMHQWLALPPPTEWMLELPPHSRPFANFSQPNHLSTLLALAAAATLRWFELRRLGPWTTGLAIAVFGWGIAITQSRTGWLFVIVLAAGSLLLQRRTQMRVTAPAVVVGCLLFAAMVLVQGDLQAAWLQLDEAAALRTAAGTRTIHWQTLADAAWHSPWFGYGWNQVSHAQFEWAQDHAASGEYVMHSHNIVLDLALYNGVPIAVAAIGGFGWWLWRTLHGCRDGGTWFLAAALLALLAHALLEYPLHYLYFLLPAGLLAGVLHASTRDREPAAAARSPATLWVPALGLAGLLALVAVDYLRAEEALRRLRLATARIGITLADLQSPDLIVHQGWKAYHDAALVKARAGMPASELDMLRDVARRYSYAPALQRYAHALALNGQPEDARRVLGQLCKTYPPHIQAAIRDSWGEMQAANGTLQGVTFPVCNG